MNYSSDLLLEAKDIVKKYPVAGSRELAVLKGIDLQLKNGEIIAIIGHSGAGKSTLLHILGGLDRPTEGEVHVNGTSIFSMDDFQLARFRNQTIGFVFQFHYLLPEFTALENLSMPLLINRENKASAQEKAIEMLTELGLEDRMNHRPRELSGGEQQRIAFGRALINDPLLILADEPSGNLDLKNSQSLHEQMWNLVKKRGKTFLIVTHNRELAGNADRIIELIDGKAVVKKKDLSDVSIV